MRPSSKAWAGLSLILLAACNTQRQVGPVSQGDNIEPNRAQVEDRVASAEERTRMERYVADLQSAKSVVRSFRGPSGETIDCVDVMSQPALRRRGMEDHKIQFAPSTAPPPLGGPGAAAAPAAAAGAAPGAAAGGAAQAATPPGETLRAPEQLYTLTGETCPEKTAPMTRLTMETLRRFRTLDEFLRKGRDLALPIGGGDGGSPAHEYAHAARTIDNWGAESILNLWSPFVERENEFSLSQIWVVRGSGESRETVETGWQVYRDLYGDWRAHLFIYFTPDNYGSGGCYNLSCNAFVQVNNTVYIGGGFTSYSTLDGPQYEIKLLFYKDGREGHWWLRYGDTWVGYYPRSLFDNEGLQNFAARVDYGGEIVNRRTDNRHTRTDMGSGHWPYEGFGRTAYHRAIRYVDTSNFYQRATGLNRSVTNDQCYDLSLSSSTGSWEEYFYFGGSGYNSSCP